MNIKDVVSTGANGFTFAKLDAGMSEVRSSSTALPYAAHGIPAAAADTSSSDVWLAPPSHQPR